ncbi:MAG TPA: glycosyltransferase family 2 protein [Methanocella sp.]|jgi:glycosyltransferase involved in cell wall biosynthesis
MTVAVTERIITAGNTTSRGVETVAILPAYNLESSIGEIIARTKPYVDVVIVVTDGSKDNTHAKAVESGAACPPHSASRGKGFAVRKGIEFSKQFRPEYVILMDSDGQHLPEEIPGLLEAIKKGGVDMIVGSRMKGELRTSAINKFGNFCLKVISFAVTSRWLSDTESGFRLFRADRLYELPLSSVSYEVESELLLRSLHRGYTVKEIPITVPKAVPGVTVKDGIKMGMYKIRTGLQLKFARAN